MKIKYIETREAEIEIELPFYYIGRMGHKYKCHDNYKIELSKDSLVIIKEHLNRDFNDRNLARFIEHQSNLKEQFETELADLLKRL